MLPLTPKHALNLWVILAQAIDASPLVKFDTPSRGVVVARTRVRRFKRFAVSRANIANDRYCG